MDQPITPHLRRLLQARDTIAAQAIAAHAHSLPTATELTTQQNELEEQLENQLPIKVWRRLYPRWVVTDVLRSHDPRHPQPKHCQICAAQTATRPRRLRLSA